MPATLNPTKPGPIEPRSATRPSRRRRFFTKVWRMLDDSVDVQIRPAKEDILVDLPTRIIEIGPGRGSNFPYYKDGTEVLALEPNFLFHDDLTAKAEEHGVRLETRATGLLGADLPAESEDAIISTLVLCSVPDAEAELAEVRRVLRPGGVLVFAEHVAGKAGRAPSVGQRILRRPWSLMTDGCDLCNRTMEAVERAGFSQVDAKLDRLGPAADPSSLMYWGRATR